MSLMRVGVLTSKMAVVLLISLATTNKGLLLGLSLAEIKVSPSGPESVKPEVALTLKSRVLTYWTNWGLLGLVTS